MQNSEGDGAGDGKEFLKKALEDLRKMSQEEFLEWCRENCPWLWTEELEQRQAGLPNLD